MATVARVPVTFRVIALLSLFWNGFGGFDFIMTQWRDPDYIAQLPSDMIYYLDHMPPWAVFAWALGVWGSVLGSLLLLARSHLAVIAFAASLFGLAVSTVYQLSGDPTPGMTTPAMLVMTGIIWVSLIFFLWYSRRAKAKGWLR
ncbi:MAG: hypothetical protein ABW184_01145 [Sphingobium sp.]